MEKYIAQDYKDIADEICSSVEHFLAHPTQYATDIVVAIDKNSRKAIVESPQKISAEYTQFSIADFILTNEKGLYEPDLNFIYGDNAKQL